MADNSIQAATDVNFEVEVLTASSTQPVMVDFWAEWCRRATCWRDGGGDCARLCRQAQVDEAERGEAMNSAGRYRVQGIPTRCCLRRAGCGADVERCRKIKSPRRWTGHLA